LPDWRSLYQSYPDQRRPPYGRCFHLCSLSPRDDLAYLTGLDHVGSLTYTLSLFINSIIRSFLDKTRCRLHGVKTWGRIGLCLDGAIGRNWTGSFPA